MNSTKRVITACVFLIVFGIIGIHFDSKPSEWIHQNTVLIDSYLQVATKLGEGYFLVSICCVFGIFLYSIRSSFHRAAWLALSSFLISGLISQILKIAFGRPRPFLAWDPRYTGVAFEHFNPFKIDSNFSSFPSGHATALFATVWIVYSLKLPKWFRVTCMITAIAGSLTRVALGKHFLADILVGAGIGILVSQIVLSLYKMLASQADDRLALRQNIQKDDAA